LKVCSRAKLAGGMPLQRKQCVIAVHAAAVIDHANQRNSTATNDDIDVAGAGVETVLNQFLHDRCRTFYYFASRHLAGQGLRKQSDPAHLVCPIVNSRFPIAKKIDAGKAHYRPTRAAPSVSFDLDTPQRYFLSR